MLEALVGLLIFSLVINYSLTWVAQVADTQKQLHDDIHMMLYAASALDLLATPIPIPSDNNYQLSHTLMRIDEQRFSGDELFNRSIRNPYYAACTVQKKGESTHNFSCISSIDPTKISNLDNTL